MDDKEMEQKEILRETIRYKKEKIDKYKTNSLRNREMIIKTDRQNYRKIDRW